MSRISTNAELLRTDIPLNSDQLAEITGTWLNTNRLSPEILKVQLTRRGDGLSIRVYGTDGDAAVDWGQGTVIPHVSRDAPHEVSGFEARISSPRCERYLAANIKLGVLVIQCYNHGSQAENKGSYFTREFFHRNVDSPTESTQATAGSDGEGLPCMKAADARDPSANLSEAAVDLDCHLGTWRNTHRHTRAISHLQLFRDGDAYLMHAFGVASPRDWGPVPIVACSSGVDSRKPSAFIADYDFSFMQMRLAANFNKGLLIIAGYSCFPDSDVRTSYFTREFFYHEQTSGESAVAD